MGPLDEEMNNNGLESGQHFIWTMEDTLSPTAMTVLMVN